MTDIYTLSGLPGAGKTYFAEKAIEELGGDIIHVGEMLRKQWKLNNPEAGEPTSDELGKFAALRREIDGDGFAMRPVGRRVEMGDDLKSPIFIDSVRHIDGLRFLRDRLETDVNAIWLSAHFDIRLERIQIRGRDDEGKYSIPDLLARDERELEKLGAGTLLDNMQEIDYFIRNEGKDLTDAIRNL